MRRGWSAAWAAGLVGLVWVLLHLAWYPHHQLTDVALYRHYGDSIVHTHTVPYRDFKLEYPPGALPTFMVPAWLEPFDYRKSFQIEMLLCHLALVLAVLGIAGRRAAAFAAAAPLLLGSVVLSRFDLWPAALAAAALFCLVRGRRAGSAVLLATSFAAKLWAAALGPIALVWIWRREGRRRALEWLAATLAAAAAWFVPFAVFSPGGLSYMFHRQLARPLQIESLGSMILAASHLAFGTSEAVVTTFGSQNLVGTGTHAAATISTVLEVLVVLAIWALFARGEMTEQRLLLASAAVVASLIAFGKVFSPQFLIWLIPFIPAVRRMVSLAVFGIALVLTQIYFPARYWELVENFRGRLVAIVLVRDLVVVALVVVLTYTLARDSTSSKASSSPGAS